MHDPGTGQPARELSPPPRDVPRWITTLLVVLLLVVHFTLAVASKREHSTTSDELVHLTGGFSYWQLHDYRLHPENGILPQRWAALPTYLQGAKFPPLDQVYWRTSDSWVMGHQFFYETGEDHFPRLMAGRAMIALFSVATGLLVFAWSNALFGRIAGLLSLGLFAFSPTFLAHGGLVTSDVCMTFFFLASLGMYWRHLHDGSTASGWLSALTFGLACVAKFSAVLLLPMLAVLAVARWMAAAPLQFGSRKFSTPGSKAGALAISAAVHAAAAVLIIWSFYGFRYSAFNPELPPAVQFIRSWASVNQTIGFQGKVIAVLARFHVLPEGFLYGYAYVLDSTHARAAFLNGRYGFTGFVSFFPWAFALKTTITVLIVCVSVLALTARRWWRRSGVMRSDLYRVLPLVVLFLVYWGISLTSHLNIGQRHILPTYPVIFIAAGALAAALHSRRRGALWLVGLLVLVQAVEAIQIAPHFLAYFNPIGGGPRTAFRHLVDSSLDWGQDLPGLKRWLDQNRRGNEPTFVAYFGSGEPDYYGIGAERLIMVNGFKLPQSFARLEPGLYCISATTLQHVYSAVRGPWTVAYEKAYTYLRTIEPQLADYFNHPEQQRDLEARFPGRNWAKLRDDYELLSFARLCHYLRERKPEAQIGYSIHVYRLSPQEFEQVVNGGLAGWESAIRNAVMSRRN